MYSGCQCTYISFVQIMKSNPTKITLVTSYRPLRIFDDFYNERVYYYKQQFILIFNMYIVLFIPIYNDYNQNPELNVLVIFAISNLAGLADVSTARC